MIRSFGPPDAGTPGNIGDIYLDLDTKVSYKCIDVIPEVITTKKQWVTSYDHSPNTQYVWIEMEGKSYDIKDFSYFCSEDTNSMNSATRVARRLDELKYIDTSSGTDFSYMFYYCNGTEEIPFFNTSNGTKFNSMFYNCKQLVTVPNLDTSNGTTFKSMFTNCTQITSIPNLNTCNGVDFESMFSGCTKLVTVPNLDTSKGITFSSMFSQCTNLNTAPELDVSNATTVSSMFYYCSNLTTVYDLDTNNCTNFSSMFYKCEKLTTVQSLDINNGTHFSQMFMGCDNLTNLYLHNIRNSIQLYGAGSGPGAIDYGTLLTVDSLVNTFKELCKVSNKQTLTIGSVNINKINGLYCKVLDDTTEKIDMELCESSVSGAISLPAYAALKNWEIT